MPLLLISYDLIKPEKDYPKLIEYLEGIGAKRVLYSEWMLRTDSGRDAIFNSVKARVDENDALMVCELDSVIGTNLKHPLGDL